MGRIASGEIKIDTKIKILPSGMTSEISEIFIGKKSLKKAVSGESVTFTMKDHIDVSRGRFDRK